MKTNDYRLTVAICAVDETTLLEQTFNKIYAYGKHLEFLFVLSRNCSKECLETVQTICKNHSDCRCAIQSAIGLGNAIQDAFRLAKGTHVIFWSADDDIDSTPFSKMVELSEKNPEAIVKISRWLPGGGFEGYGGLRRTANYLSQKLIALLYHSKLTDFTNPTQIAPLALYKRIHWENSDAAILPEMVCKPLRLGCVFLEVPCKTRSNSKKNSHIGFFTHLKYYFIIFKIRSSSRSGLFVREI